jgi:hypothetical protein
VLKPIRRQKDRNDKEEAPAEPLPRTAKHLLCDEKT